MFSASSDPRRPMGRDDALTASTYVGPSEDPISTMVSLERTLFRHAIMVWVFFPGLALMQMVLPFLAPTCLGGFNDWTLIAVVLVEIHHLWAESQAWHLAKSLLKPPEVGVLRQLGVLKKRRSRVLLGVVEDLDLYTDITFPFVAHVCDEMITSDWQQAWKALPVIGGVCSDFIGTFRFWGCALLLASINILISGLFGMSHIFQSHDREKAQFDRSGTCRIHGTTFFGWAQSAETAMMPSVSMFCAEMANQQKWTYDASKDARQATEARGAAGLGKLDWAKAEEMEIRNQEEEDRVEAASRLHYILLLVVKVFIGNVMMLFLQGSFFALTFESTGAEGRYKVILSMVVSAVHAGIRCILVIGKLGLVGVGLTLVIFLFIAFSFAKVYFAFVCTDHLWNMSTGCVTLSEEFVPAGH